MGVWKTLTRPKSIGLYVQDGTVYAKRYTSHPGYRELVAPEERTAFLQPIPVPLHNARVFLDSETVGQRSGAVGVGVGPFIPIIPVSLGSKKVFAVEVRTGDGQIFRGWSGNGDQAARLYRKVRKLIKRANAPAKGSNA
jgi:hypothetical protein